MAISLLSILPGGIFYCGRTKSMSHKFRAVGNDHFCDTTKRASQRLTLHIKGEIPLYHRSGDKPLDPTTLHKFETMVETIVWYLQGNHPKPGLLRWCEMDCVHPQYHNLTAARLTSIDLHELLEGAACHAVASGITFVRASELELTP